MPDPAAVGHDDVRRADRRAARERERHRIADAAVGELEARVAAADGNGRKQARNRRARAYRIVQRYAGIRSACEVIRIPRPNVVADDAEAGHAVVEAIERRPLELSQPLGDDPAPPLEPRAESSSKLYVNAVHQQMPPAERARVTDQVADVQSDRGILGRNHRARADSDDCVNRHLVLDQPAKHADVRGAAQSARAEDESDHVGMLSECRLL